MTRMFSTKLIVILITIFLTSTIISAQDEPKSMNFELGEDTISPKLLIGTKSGRILYIDSFGKINDLAKFRRENGSSRIKKVETGEKNLYIAVGRDGAGKTNTSDQNLGLKYEINQDDLNGYNPENGHILDLRVLSKKVLVTSHDHRRVKNTTDHSDYFTRGSIASLEKSNMSMTDEVKLEAANSISKIVNNEEFFPQPIDRIIASGVEGEAVLLRNDYNRISELRRYYPLADSIGGESSTKENLIFSGTTTSISQPRSYLDPIEILNGSIKGLYPNGTEIFQITLDTKSRLRHTETLSGNNFLISDWGSKKVYLVDADDEAITDSWKISGRPLEIEAIGQTAYVVDDNDNLSLINLNKKRMFREISIKGITDIHSVYS